jgi:hypothetical protein
MKRVPRAAAGLAALFIIVAPTTAAALCIPPVEAMDLKPEVPVSYRYAWYLIESWKQASLAWREVSDTDEPIAHLAHLKLAVEDFHCARSLVLRFQGIGGDSEHTTKGLELSVLGTATATKTFADSRQWLVERWERGETPSLKEAADLKVEVEKAGELLIRAFTGTMAALLDARGGDPKAPMDRLVLTGAQRAALLKGLQSRFPDVGTPAIMKGHTPDLSAELLYRLLSNPRYKATDEP